MASHLTVNLGVRYDVLTGPVDKNDALNIGFDPNIQTNVSQLPGLTGGLLFANVNGNPRSPVATYFGNIQPRIGFAWQPVDRLVVRGGYGIFYTNFLNLGMLNQNGFSATTQMNTSNDGGRHPIAGVVSNPLPSGIIEPAGSSLGAQTGIGTQLYTYNTHYKIPRANQFSLGIQYRLLRNGVLDASYVGNRVVNYDMTYDANIPNWSFLQTCDELYGAGQMNNCQAMGTNPFENVSAFKGTPYYSNPTVDEYDLHRPHNQFIEVTTQGLNRAHNYYNGLQLDYRQRMTHGVSMDANFVWSKQIEQWGWLSQALNIPQRSPYNYGLPHAFKISGVFQVPVGHGRALNLKAHRLGNMIFGDWDFSPQFTVQSGEPANLPANAYPLPHNKFYKHPDWSKAQVKGWNNCVLSKDNTGVISILDAATAARCGADMSQYDWVMVPLLPYEQAQPTNSSVIRMKQMILSDAALQKSVHLRNGINVIMRLSSSNVLNHFNILTAKYDTNPADGANFGTIRPGETTALDSPPRNLNVQFRVAF